MVNQDCSDITLITEQLLRAVVTNLTTGLVMVNQECTDITLIRSTQQLLS